MAFEITRNSYHIIIVTPNERKEIISLRLSSKVLFCKECNSRIEAGEKYIRDKFIFFNSYYGTFKRKSNFICLKCWRGEVPSLVSTNWVKK